MNQKQRLLKQTQIQSTFDKNLIEKDLKKKEEEKSAKTIIFGALRKISGGSRKSSKESKCCPEALPEDLCRDPPSPRTPPNSPEILPPKPPSPLVAAARRTPVPSDSPLLSKVRPDPILKRIRSFNKSLKKASSFRQNQGKASEQVVKKASPTLLTRKEVTFKVKKTTTGRMGWKIMPEDEGLNLKINKDVMDQVMDRIRSMQYSGEVV